MASDDACSKLNMTTDSAKSRTLDIPPSGVASDIEAALGVTVGGATAHLLNASAAVSLEESLATRSLGLLQAEVEATQRAATASVSPAAAMTAADVRRASAASSYADAVRADFIGATDVMLASQAALGISAVSSTFQDADRIAEMSHSTAAAAITADVFTNSLSEQLAGTSRLAKSAALGLLDSQMLAASVLS